MWNNRMTPATSALLPPVSGHPACNLATFIFTALFLCAGHRVLGLTNLVNNGSFDSDPWGWSTEGSGFQYNPGYVRFLTSVWQDLNTVPGRDYIVRFAWKESLPRLYWGAEIYDTFTNTPAMSSWPHVYRFVRATTYVTQLRFESTAATSLDNVLVGWLLEPVQIIQQPQGRSAIEGGAVSFSVTAGGGPPLRYQWFFNGHVIVDATNEFLIKNSVSQPDQGEYHVVVSNSANAVTSTVAQLTSPRGQISTFNN